MKSFLSRLYIPPSDSHKGQNGKVLVVGGSALFHSSPIWAAEMASHFADMVHFSSTKENNKIIVSLKKQFRNGMVIHQADIPAYIAEDDAVLVGPGMVRAETAHSTQHTATFKDIIAIHDEAEYTRAFMYFLIKRYPEKQMVIDAGALQMMDKEWLQWLKQPAIITPHKFEFHRLFDIVIDGTSPEEKEAYVQKMANEYNCIILLKSVDDYISDGKTSVRVIGGNQGLTKGGTGDVLSGLVVSLYAKNEPLVSAVVASFLQKRAAERLSETKGYWYNTTDLLGIIPDVLTELIYNERSKK